MADCSAGELWLDATVVATQYRHGEIASSIAEVQQNKDGLRPKSRSETTSRN
jgi:hypothetical protein